MLNIYCSAVISVLFSQLKMPVRVNQRAVEARERKAAVAAAKMAALREEAESRLWEDNDKHVSRKLDRRVGLTAEVLYPLDASLPRKIEVLNTCHVIEYQSL